MNWWLTSVTYSHWLFIMYGKFICVLQSTCTRPHSSLFYSLLMAPLQIIGSGLSRTGTAAMREALTQLGYNVHHMIVMMRDPSADTDVFVEAWEGKEVDWNRAYGNFDAVLDWPSAAFYKELLETYPDAKVIHTTRDPESWHTSIKKTVYPVVKWADDPSMSPHVIKTQQMVRTVVWDGEMQGKTDDREFSIQMFRDREDEVRRTVPADKLLIFETGVDGWEKLCKFLGKPVPNTPWPHSNSTEEFIAKCRPLFLIDLLYTGVGCVSPDTDQ
jgi:hypothetical protein